MRARLREALGRWLCLRGFHRFVRRWERVGTTQEFAGWNKICARMSCGQKWELVRESALVEPRPLTTSEASWSSMDVDAAKARAVEKSEGVGHRFEDSTRLVFKVTGVSKKKAGRLLRRFKKGAKRDGRRPARRGR
jgi:hypothetical protein